ETGATQFDLFLEIFERNQQAILRLQYCTDLFKRSTARRLLGQLRTLLEAAVNSPDTPISRLPLLTTPERREILVGWNQTSSAYPEAPAYQLIEAQAKERPDATAAVHGTRTWTYAELSHRSDSIARALTARGLQRGGLVGICVERSLEMLAM